MYEYETGSLYPRVHRVPAHILLFAQHVPARIFVLAPSGYITIRDHTRIIRRYHIHGNPARISILLGITRTSLNNVKERRVGQDEYVYNSYARNNHVLHRVGDESSAIRVPLASEL